MRKREEQQTTEADDATLIRRYAEERSEEAFALLMRRYLDLVYSICRRELPGGSMAEDAAQIVFLHLSRKAPTLQNRTETIVGWLFQTARLVCRNMRRQQLRRNAYEEQAAQEASRTLEQPERNDLWGRVEPTLFDALESLRQEERELLLMRYFQEQDFAEIGRLRGISPDAARMRTSRALSRLRNRLSGMGILTPSDKSLESVLTPPYLFLPAPSSCEAAILQLIRTDTAAALLSHAPHYERIYRIYQEWTKTMRLKTLRSAAVALAGIGIVTLGLTGSRGLRAANVAPAVPFQEPAAPLPATPPAPATQTKAAARAVLVSIRVLEKTTARDGRAEEKLLQAPRIVTQSGQEGVVKIVADNPEKGGKSSWTVAVLPTLNDDRTIALHVTWSHQEEEMGDGETRRNHTVETRRRVRSGQVSRITLFKGSNTEMLLEVTAQEQKDKPAGP
jgi:RNA polymerase sigma factor (sigma-70 family)